MSRRCSVTLLDEGNQSAKVTVFYCFTDPRGPREDWESRRQGCHRRHRHTYPSPQEPPDWLIASIVADNAQIETCGNKGTSDHILHFLSYFHHGQFTPAVQSGQGAHSFSHNLMKGGQKATDTQYIYMQSLIGGGIYHEAGSDMTGTDTMLLWPPDRLSLVSDSLNQSRWETSSPAAIVSWSSKKIREADNQNRVASLDLIRHARFIYKENKIK